VLLIIVPEHKGVVIAKRHVAHCHT
jgi:hypothetical protein